MNLCYNRFGVQKYILNNLCCVKCNRFFEKLIYVKYIQYFIFNCTHFRPFSVNPLVQLCVAVFLEMMKKITFDVVGSSVLDQRKLLLMQCAVVFWTKCMPAFIYYSVCSETKLSSVLQNNIGNIYHYGISQPSICLILNESLITIINSISRRQFIHICI